VGNINRHIILQGIMFRLNTVFAVFAITTKDNLRKNIQSRDLFSNIAVEIYCMIMGTNGTKTFQIYVAMKKIISSIKIALS
jgi:hypothetical protein